MRRGFQRKLSKIRAEKAKRSSLDPTVRMGGAEVRVRKSSYNDLRSAWEVRRWSGFTKKGRTENQTKGSARVLLPGFTIVLFCIIFMIEKDMKRDRGRRKVETADVRKIKENSRGKVLEVL